VRKSNVNRDLLTTRQAGEMLGVTLRTVQLWVESGVIPAWRTAGGHRRIARGVVEKLVAQRLHKLQPPVQSEMASAEPQRLRILLVEDDANLLHLFALIVQKWSFPVELITAADGFEGLLRIGQMRPHMVVTDLNMPLMDGFEMLRAIKKPGSGCGHLTLVVITAYSSEEIAAKGGLPEGMRCFTKPVDYGKLRAIAEQLFHRLVRTEDIAV
jgi:excisionase family DNA binding protein